MELICMGRGEVCIMGVYPPPPQPYSKPAVGTHHTVIHSCFQTVKQLEQKKTEQTVTKVGGSLGIVGGVGAAVGAGVLTVVTGGLAAPLLIRRHFRV